jgi:hypothetical protein
MFKVLAPIVEERLERRAAEAVNPAEKPVSRILH